MIIRRTFDPEEIKTIICDEWIYDRVSEDFTPEAHEFEPPVRRDHTYLVDEELNGLFILHPINSITQEVHVHVLDREKAMEFGEAVINWAWSNMKFNKMVAQIPEIYPDVARFAEKNGFVKEGVNRQSYLKNGTIHDQYYYGLVRPWGS